MNQQQARGGSDHRPLRAALGRIEQRAASAVLVYPDTDNQMEEGVFSFAKRDDERRVWRSLVQGLFDTDDAVLDVGCGLGAFVDDLRQRSGQAFFVDRDPGRLQQARQAHGKDEGAFFVVDPAAVDVSVDGDLEKAFAFVQAIQVLGHLSKDDGVVLLTSMAAMTRTGGHVLVAVPFTSTPFDVYVVTHFVTATHGPPGKPTPKRVSRQQFEDEARAPTTSRLPVRHFSMPSLTSLFQQAGLQLVSTTPYHWFDEVTGDLFALGRRL